ncbi:hypothetical protein RMATCC62417_01213 [Rhizopus microsporus]|nr:hypothetical protein RMATCC62417_01213 [Rhizopus microsporus]
MGSNQEKGTQTYIAGHNIAEADQTSSYTSEYSTDTDKVTLPKEREFHHVKTSTYWLPKDDDERMRLTGQHFALKEIFEGNVLPHITKALDFNSGVSILDVGCGPGAWVMDMIDDYPNCTYEGCDIVNVIGVNAMPKQFTFTMANVLEGLPYPDNSFDFVHMRLFIYALKKEEWPIAVKELLRVTKPGGFVQLMETDNPIPKHTGTPIYRVMVALHAICKERGQNPFVGRELEELLTKSGNVKIVESRALPFDTTTGTNAAKSLAWTLVEFVKGGMTMLGPMLGLKDDHEKQSFIKEFKKCLTNTYGELKICAVAAQKM